jgi:DNA invertase Pin-like site-specific DNA recombinase
MKAFIYLRVSTPGQAKNGVSISRGDDIGFQEERCRALCAFKGWEVAGVFSDAGITGRRKGDKKRDGLAAGTDATCKAQGVLVVFAVARLGRSAGYIHNMADKLEDAGANIASACEPIDTSTAMGRAFFGVTAVFAQLESDQISDRTRAAHKFLRDAYKANVIGQPPYGYSRAKGTRDLIKHPGEQAILAAVRRWRKPICPGEPPTPYSIIAQRLNEAGHVTRESKRFPHGGPWTEGSVYRILNGRKKKAPAGGTHD